MRKLLLSCLLFCLGCATGVTGLLRLQDRELLIHPDKPGLGYPYKKEVCTKNKGIKKIFKKYKCKNVQMIDFYDFNDKATRDKLRAAGFTCKSKMRFKY